LRNKTQYIVATTIAVLLISMFAVFPSYAFINPNGTTDSKYEYYGPHADQLQFKFYAGDDAMFTALQTGQIDICDEALTAAWRTTFSGDPNINVVAAGGEAGFYVIDFNVDPYKFVPESIRAPYANPVYVVDAGEPGGGIPPISTNVFFRIGVSALFNRAPFNALMGASGVQILTPLPSFMGGYIWPGAYAYEYSRVQAEANFTAGNIKQDKTTSPWTRYWDYNNDGVAQASEKLAAQVIFTWRSTQYRRAAGEALYAELLAMNFTVATGAYAPPPAKVGGMRDGATNYQQVMLDKNYHITTLGWINVGPDPDFLYDLYHVTSFWDDPESSCPNTADLNDTVLNTYAEGIKFALDSTAAKTAAWNWQQRFEAIAAQIPLYSAAVYSASRKWYSGGNAETVVSPDDGENIYRRVGGSAGGAKNEWLDLNVQSGFGTHTWFSYLDAYPNGSLYGNGHMTFRYGWREQGYPQHINPFYSEWYWDSIILGAIYDTPGYRNPYDLSQWNGILINTWSVGTWLDGTTTKSKVTLTLRPDMTWQDGTPITMADVVFSLVEAGPTMIARGFSPPWWWPTGELVRSLSILDPYTVEILYNVQSFLAESWTLGGITVVPKHIWKPIILSPSGPTGFAPDPNIIGSGPWRFLSFTPLISAVLVANKPGSTVKTDRTGSVPITSPAGFYNYYPKQVDLHVLSPVPYATKLILPVTTPPTTHMLVTFALNIKNWLANNDLVVNKYLYVDGVLQPGFPVDRTIPPLGKDMENGTVGVSTTVDLTRGVHTIKLAVHIKGPTDIEINPLGHSIKIPNPWISHWDNATIKVYITRVEDISGSTLYDDIGLPSYPFKTELPSPDTKVNLVDVFAAGKAFGSKPGSAKWFSPADINHDYKIDLKDYFAITKAFNK